MLTNLFCRFTDHPKAVCMNYFQHFSFSIGLSFYFFKKSIQALIHSVYPNLYITSSSDVPKELEDKFSNVGCKSKSDMLLIHDLSENKDNESNDESNDETNDETNDDSSYESTYESIYESNDELTNELTDEWSINL